MNAIMNLPPQAGPRQVLLSQMLHPQSVAIIGASAQMNKVNGRPLKHLLTKGYAGKIYPVNPKYEEIGGLRCYADAGSLPEAPDLAIIAVPAQDVAASLEALGEAGGRAAVVFSSGFGEMGPEGAEQEKQLLQIARKHGIALCGPNCLGFINAFDHVYATFSQYADGACESGPVGFVTQSGAFGTAIAALANERGLGLGYFINTGNEADVTFSELMHVVVEDPRIRVVAGYLEGLEDGQALIDLALKCHALGKPLVLVKVGRTASGARAAASHTGSLAVEDSLFDAITRQYGILRARNEEQLLDMVQALASTALPEGNGLGIVTQSGGSGVMMTDRAEEVGLKVPAPSPETSARLATVMPAFGSAGNPVDVTAQFIADPTLLRDAVLFLLEDPQVNIAVIWLQLMHGHADRLADIFADIRSKTAKPFIVCWVAAPAGMTRRLRDCGIAMFGAGERAVEAAASLVRYAQMHRKVTEASAAAPPPPQRLPVADGAAGTEESVRLLTAAGVPMAPVRLAATAAAAVQAWRDYGGPVALKIESPDILHKTDLGGVALGLDDADAVQAAFERIVSQCKRHKPDARVLGVIVQPMQSGHTELVVGVKRDAVFGPMVMVGCGGIFLEILRDVTFRRAPFSAAQARDMLDELRMRPLLDGARGRPPVDIEQLCTMLARLSAWVAAVSGQLAELDLNPLLVGADGPVGVDSVMLIRTVCKD